MLRPTHALGVLTNGIEYRFYADLDKTNIMDEKPFLVVNMLDLSDADIEEMKKFHKSCYNESEILSTAKGTANDDTDKGDSCKRISSLRAMSLRGILSEVLITGNPHRS